MTDTAPVVSVVVLVTTADVPLGELVEGYSRPLREAGYPFEIVLVLDGVGSQLAERTRQLGRDYPVKTVVLHGGGLGEAIALLAGVDSSSGELIVNAPQYLQSIPQDMMKVVRSLESGVDFVATWRSPRVDPWLNRMQSRIFNWVMGLLMGSKFHDLNSAMRGMRRHVLDEVSVYGELYRFLPVLAQRQGFKVVEVKVRHREEKGRKGFYGFGVYLRRGLDILAISFLTRFTQRPLRFFGMLGLLAILLGVALSFGPLYAKLIHGDTLTDRPIFVIGAVLVAFGVQLIGFGLVGEIIIFTQAHNLRDYQVEQVLEGTIEAPGEAARAAGEEPGQGIHARELLPGEDARWDAFVTEHPQGTFFHLSGWRKVVEDTFGHEPIYLVAEQSRQWLGILPLFRISSPFLGLNLISVPYAVYGGVLRLAGDSSKEVDRLLMDAAANRGREQGADYVELRQLSCQHDGLPSSDLYVTYRKELPEDPAGIMPEIPKRARAEVRRARDRFDLRFEESQDLAVFYKLFVANKRRLGSPALPRRWFRALKEEFGKRVVIHVAREPGGEAIAAVMSFCFKNTVYAYYSGSVFDKNKTGVNNFIYCRIMEWCARQGYRVFDFGRSRRDSGPAAFKKNMGFAAEVLHYQYYLLRKEAVLPDFNPSNPKLDLPRRIWSHLPPVVARGLSGPLSKYLP